MTSEPSAPDFAISTHSDDTAHVVRVEGELDLNTRDQLVAVLDGLSRPPQIVVLDGSAMSFVDSTGLRVLLSEHQRARAEGYEFVIAGATPPVRETLRLTALDLTLPLAPDVESVTRG
ncbi:STAS domain-containing protein [Baekduia soli]|uniref:Anti-sigma factor antagonist n=1 Tax=Baekduia soli TaxID=496014 RepID=A0A5B8U392_9ACTN|nr:STAS domain-containing protein [Baekduia soli]QEC47412.1 STAS domain-containing protein [Baekduia soli]